MRGLALGVGDPTVSLPPDEADAANHKGKGKAWGGGDGNSGQSNAPSSSPSTALALSTPSQDPPPSAPPPPSEKKKKSGKACGGCGATGGKLLRCSKCHLVFYCTRECQA